MVTVVLPLHRPGLETLNGENRTVELSPEPESGPSLATVSSTSPSYQTLGPTVPSPSMPRGTHCSGNGPQEMAGSGNPNAKVVLLWSSTSY